MGKVTVPLRQPLLGLTAEGRLLSELPAAGTSPSCPHFFRFKFC